MNAFWSVLKREADERRLLVPGALALGLAPFAAGLILGGAGRDMAPERLMIALVLAAVATTITALFLGGSVVARDLAERRLSFYFARPIPGWVIWAGKMAAAAAMSLITGALVLLPAVLTGAGRPGVDSPPNASLILVVVTAVLGILGMAHAVSVLLRTRSPWLLLDLAGGLVIPWIVLEARAPLVQAGISGFGAQSLSVLNGGYFALAVLLVAAALGAGALQMAVARTDPRRGHKVLSLTFWGTALTAALLFAGFSRWVMRVELQDLHILDTVVAAPTGPWVLASGPAHRRPGFNPLFLLDTATGRSVRIDAGARLVATGSSVRLADGHPLDFFSPFSADGSHAVWLEPQGGSLYRVLALDLTRPESRPSSTLVSFTDPPLFAAITRDGSRLAAVENGGRRLLVHDLRRGALLAAENLPAFGGGTLRFDGPDRVLLRQSTLTGSEGGCLVLDIQLSTRTSQWRSCDEDRLELSQGARLPHPTPYAPVWESFVQRAGDRMVWDVRTEDSMDLLIQKDGESPEGPKRRVRFPGARRLDLGGQPSARHLLVQVNRVEKPTNAARIYAVDLDTGEKRLLGTGLGAIAGAAEAAPGSPATHLFYDQRNLVRIDPETGRRTVILRLS